MQQAAEKKQTAPAPVKAPRKPRRIVFGYPDSRAAELRALSEHSGVPLNKLVDVAGDLVVFPKPADVWKAYQQRVEARLGIRENRTG